ncbi:hypothetical protein L915_15000, partial [Phytophthora nicotianae]
HELPKLAGVHFDNDQSEYRRLLRTPLVPLRTKFKAKSSSVTPKKDESNRERGVK